MLTHGLKANASLNASALHTEKKKSERSIEKNILVNIDAL